MDKSNIRGLVLRLKQTLDALSTEMVNGFVNRDNPGKSQSSRLKRNNLISRVQHLTKSIKTVLFKGHILKVTYIQQVPGQADRKFQAVLTDVSKEDFEYFIREFNQTKYGPKIVILEILETPTFIKEVPL